MIIQIQILIFISFKKFCKLKTHNLTKIKKCAGSNQIMRTKMVTTEMDCQLELLCPLLEAGS
jgi:hypothetical protein